MSRFVKVTCQCGNTFSFFGDAKSKVHCEQCNAVVATPRGGRARIHGKIEEVMG